MTNNSALRSWEKHYISLNERCFRSKPIGRNCYFHNVQCILLAIISLTEGPMSTYKGKFIHRWKIHRLFSFHFWAFTTTTTTNVQVWMSSQCSCLNFFIFITSIGIVGLQVSSSFNCFEKLLYNKSTFLPK